MLLREWSAARYPGVYLAEQMKLGPTPITLNGVVVSPAFARMLTVSNWKVDGELVLDDSILLIEAKMVATPQAVGQVEFYVRQAKKTPDLLPHLNKPIQPVVLWAEDIADVSAYARSRSIRVEVYTPSWIESYMQRVQFRNRSTSPVQASEGSEEESPTETEDSGASQSS